MRRFIEEDWLSYKQRVISQNAGETQLRESRLAFFAGAVTCFRALAMSEKGMTEEQKYEMIDVELLEFLNEFHIKTRGMDA